MAALVVALVATGTYWLWQTNLADSDGDGLTNKVEVTGWLTQDGTVYRTDPYKVDTDGDGLTDADEAGRLTSSGQAGDVYAGFSNPLLSDTDDDDLTDADEADLGLDPRDRDSDDDELGDGYEVDVVGSDPETADTDGDGFADGYEDANRETQGLDPLRVDVQVSTLTYVSDFAKGAVAGDLWREDSLAWLAGNLTSGAASSVPVVGPVVGGVADLRDAIGSAIQGDWVGSGFSAMGAVPGGDVVAIPGKAAKFIARNPHLAAAAAAIIASAAYVPDAITLKAARQIWPHWDDLVGAGASERALLQLQKGGTNLDDLFGALKRPTHVAGVPVRPSPTGTSGEAALEGMYGANTKGVDRQVRSSTAQCLEGCNSRVRIFDVLVDGVARESKVGYVVLSDFTQRQIRKDAWLIKTGQIQGAHWHFRASSRSNTIGADPRVLDLLDQVGITYTIHLPTGP